MIAGIFHQGSGLGDQLHRYVTVRTLAEEKGYDWGIINPQEFKGRSFMDIDYGLSYKKVPFDPFFLQKKMLEMHKEQTSEAMTRRLTLSKTIPLLMGPLRTLNTGDIT